MGVRTRPSAPPAIPSSAPGWDALYRVAEAQAGYFTRSDAAAAGFSAPLLHHHVAAGTLQRARRGVYRLTRFPPSDHEDLVVLWLWSGKVGVLSHETALALHGLSDALPARAHLTLPESWRRRRFARPEGLVVHFCNVSARDCTWFGSVPVTAVARTLGDLIDDYGDPGLLRQALAQAKRRGLVAPNLALRLAARHRRVFRDKAER